MGGSFPGIFFPAANQSSVPQSGNWCGQLSGFLDSQRVYHGLPGVSAWPASAMRRNQTGMTT